MAPAISLLNDTPLNQFHTQTRFMEVEATNSTDLKISLLANDIHPLFLDPLRQAVPRYTVVEQSARLASHFVECGVLDHFFRAWTKGRDSERKWQSVKDESKVGLEFAPEQIDESVPVTEADRSSVQESLRLLSENITYELDDTLSSPAITTSIVNAGFVDPRFLDGEKSNIKIKTSAYDALKRAQQNKDPIVLLTQNFTFAVMLVHEISHALDNLYCGKLDDHHFFGDGMVCEAGYEVESRLFGGIIEVYQPPKNGAVKVYRHDGRLSRLSGVLALWEYPCSHLVEEYRHGGGMELRGEPREVRLRDIAWRVPMSFLQQLFEDGFWKNVVPNDSISLRPRCSTGYCFRLNTRAERVPVSKSEDDTKYVPAGYKRLKYGDIVHNGRGRRSEDPSTTYVDTTQFWRENAAKTSGKRRPWRVISSKRLKKAAAPRKVRPGTKRPRAKLAKSATVPS